jgi:hypothetical protein
VVVRMSLNQSLIPVSHPNLLIATIFQIHLLKRKVKWDCWTSKLSTLNHKEMTVKNRPRCFVTS